MNTIKMSIYTALAFIIHFTSLSLCMDIFEACKLGKINTARKILATVNPQERSRFINSRDGNGYSPLECALDGLCCTIKATSYCGVGLNETASMDNTSSTLTIGEQITQSYRTLISYLLEQGSSGDISYIVAQVKASAAPDHQRIFTQYSLHTFQKIYFTFTRARQVKHTIALATHERLGAQSPLGLIPQFWLNYIASIAVKSEANGLQRPQEESSYNKAPHAQAQKHKKHCTIL